MIGRDGMPSKRDLDDYFPDRPIIFSDYDRHTSWVNSTALTIAGGRDKKEGSITPGKLADFVLLARDPFSATPRQLAEMKVAMTIVAGRVVYRRP